MSARIHGAMLAYIVIATNVVVTLAITPFMVHSLGKSGYGLLSLSVAIIAYLNMLDFGLNDGVIRFFVRHRKDRSGSNKFLAQTLGLYFGIGGLILVLGLVLREAIPVVFGSGLKAQEIEELQAMFVVMTIGAAVLIGLNPFGALAFAHERFVFMKGIELCTIIGSNIAIVLLLLQGHGPFAVAVVTASGKVFQATARILFCVHRLGARFAIAAPDRAELMPVVLYAAPIFVSIFAGAIFWKFDSILIGAFLGAAPVAVYTIGVTFNKYFMSFATAISRIMTPDIVRRIDAGADGATLTDLMIRISRVQALVLLMVLGGLIVFGQRFLTLWLGPDFAESYWVMLMVLAPYAIELTGNARNIVLQVKGLYWHKSAITLGMAALNIPLTIVLLRVWGVVGAAASTGLAVLAGYVAIAFLLQRRAGIEMGRYFRATGRGIVPVFACLLAAGLAGEPYLPQGWAGLVAGAVCFSVVYLAAMLVFAANSSELALFRRVGASLIPRRRRWRT